MSAGILPYRLGDGGLELLVAHMGGPLWATRDAHAWTVVKGEYDPEQESAEQAARREWAEETGAPLPDGELVELGEVRQSSKRVIAFALEAGALDPAGFVSDTFEMQWPPRSGRTQSFPEIDRAEWMPAADARERLVKAQGAFVDRLEEATTGPAGGGP